MNYTTLTSAYLRERLQKTPWARRARFDDLVTLHGYLLEGGARSFAGALRYHALKQRYPQEYLLLLEEHSPEAFQAELQRSAGEPEKHRQQLHAEKVAARAALKVQKEEWLRAGGGA